MSKRVLFVTGGYYPAVGGGEIYNERLAVLAQEGGFEPLVLVPVDDADRDGKDLNGISVRYIRTKIVAGQRIIPARRLWKEAARYRPDILQFNGPNAQDLAGFAVGATLSIPVCVLYFADFRHDVMTSRIASWVYRRAISSPVVKATFVISRMYEESLVRDVGAHRVINLGVGVDSTVFHPPEAISSSSTRTLLFVGRLDQNHTYKRIDLLLQSLASLRKAGREYVLRVVGDGDRRSEAEDTAARLGIRDAVVFLGNLNSEGLVREYQSAGALVLPSPTASEGFGMVVIEAYACGCPVVTSSMAGASEAVRESGIGALWDGANVSSLSDAIERVLSHSNRSETSAAARAYVQRRYSWSAVGQRLITAYQNILAK